MTRDLAVTLASLGHELDVVTMGFRGLPSREQVAEGVQVYRVPCWRRQRHICSTAEMVTFVAPAVWRCLQLARRRRYDVCHTHFIFPSGVVARKLAALTGLPYVITAHGSDVPGYNPDRFGLEHKLLLPLWRWVVAGASAVTFPSEFLRQLFLRSARRPPELAVIPNGVDAAVFRPSGHENKVLFAGRLLRRKGAHLLLEALTGVSLPGWEVHIAGDGPMRAEVERLASLMQTPVVMHGWLAQDSPTFRQLWSEASIFAFPSLMENCPMVLLEAMASGMAVVAAATGGSPEVVGDAGILVDPDNPEALRQAIIGLAGDPARRRALGDAARRRVEEHFAWPVVAKLYGELLGRVAGAR